MLERLGHKHFEKKVRSQKMYEVFSFVYASISERPLLKDSSVHNEDSEGGSDDSEDVGVYVECFGGSGEL